MYKQIGILPSINLLKDESKEHFASNEFDFILIGNSYKISTLSSLYNIKLTGTTKPSELIRKNHILSFCASETSKYVQENLKSYEEDLNINFVMNVLKKFDFGGVCINLDIGPLDSSDIERLETFNKSFNNKRKVELGYRNCAKINGFQKLDLITEELMSSIDTLIVDYSGEENIERSFKEWVICSVIGDDKDKKLEKHFIEDDPSLILSRKVSNFIKYPISTENNKIVDISPGGTISTMDKGSLEGKIEMSKFVEIVKSLDTNFFNNLAYNYNNLENPILRKYKDKIIIIPPIYQLKFKLTNFDNILQFERATGIISKSLTGVDYFLNNDSKLNKVREEIQKVSLKSKAQYFIDFDGYVWVLDTEESVKEKKEVLESLGYGGIGFRYSKIKQQNLIASNVVKRKNKDLRTSNKRKALELDFDM
ncbi:hypothetical protein BB560_006640 [Smittium megazygosporum]|uniref:Uncharacterized protein n=1 Tax=Smittium megazygosporum TaxID=133381 RepID=A0A2T9Y2N3_9FUNG|nr:hypothetical protein BB560_006640 [Smittium megazygosporum]